MKVEYQTILKCDGQLYEYLLACDPLFCCEEMHYAWGTTWIRFGYDSHTYTRSAHADGMYCYDGRPLNTAAGIYFVKASRKLDGLLLEYCPFCGERITTEELSVSDIAWEIKSINARVPIVKRR